MVSFEPSWRDKSFRAWLAEDQPGISNTPFEGGNEALPSFSRTSRHHSETKLGRCAWWPPLPLEEEPDWRDKTPGISCYFHLSSLMEARGNQVESENSQPDAVINNPPPAVP